jgi:hypothetical protein
VQLLEKEMSCIGDKLNQSGRSESMTTNRFSFALFAFLFSLPSAAQDSALTRRLPETFIDAAVDSKGNTYVLTQSGLKRTDVNGDILNVEIGASFRSTFESWGYQAMSVDRFQGPVVLWSGKRGNLGESYITFVESDKNIQLKQTVNFALSVSIAPNQDIYVFGISFTQKTQQLVHRFSSEGNYLGSFNPFMIIDPGNPTERHKFGRSRIIATSDGIFVLSPLFDSRVAKCVEGRVERTFDFGTTSVEGSQRRPVTLFSRDGKVYVQVFVAGTPDKARHDIYVYENGDFRLSLTTKDLPGQILGQKPDGQLVTRDVTVSARRDSIGSKLP